MCANMLLPVKAGLNRIIANSKRSAEVAERAANMQNLSVATTNVAKGKGYIRGAVTPIIDGVASASDTLGTALNTIGKVSKNVRKTKLKNPDGSKIVSTYNGVVASTPQIKEALKDISGITDIVAATKSGGAVKGVLETAKAAVRTSTTLGAFAAANLLPVPGASIAAWVGAEKLINLLLGKPFTKQVKNIVK